MVPCFLLQPRTADRAYEPGVDNYVKPPYRSTGRLSTVGSATRSGRWSRTRRSVIQVRDVQAGALRGYVPQVVPNMNSRPAMNIDMLSPSGLSGAPVIREDSNDIFGVVVGDRTIRLGRGVVPLLRGAAARRTT